MTRSLSNNLLKSNWIAVKPNSDKRLIDSNELALKRIEEERKRIERIHMNLTIDSQSDFAEGLQVEQIETLFDEKGEEVVKTDGLDCIIKTPDVLETKGDSQMMQAITYEGPSPEELIEEAKKEIEQMKIEAEIENRNLQKEVVEQAKVTGYAEGKGQAETECAKKVQQFKEKEKQLEKTYEENLKNMEIELVENLSDIYSHVLGVSLKEYGPTILHVLDVAMHESDDVKNYMVHVSKDEANMVKNNLELLRSGMSTQTEIEIIEDVTLTPGEAYIETDGEIFDCSIDTQLNNLSKELKALAYQKK